MKTITKLWLGIGILILISPLGLLLPEYFKAGDAWGEWGTESMKELAGYIPQGLEKLSSLWSAPLSDYAFCGWEDKGWGSLSCAYIASAIIGILIITCIILLIGRFLNRQECCSNEKK